MDWGLYTNIDQYSRINMSEPIPNLNEYMMLKSENIKLRMQVQDLKCDVERLRFIHNEVFKDSKAKGARLISLRNENTKLSVELEELKKR